MSRMYYLPNKEQTEDAGEYVDAWESLARPMMEMTNTTLHSFDPTVSLRGPYGWGLVILPVGFLQAFNDSYEQGLGEKEVVL